MMGISLNSLTSQQKTPSPYQGREGVPVVPPWLKLSMRQLHSFQVQQFINHCDTLRSDNGAPPAWATKISTTQLPGPFHTTVPIAITPSGDSLKIVLMC